MRSNYKKIGDYIQKVNNRNVDLKATKLLGINIDKFFMPSVANVVGTDMSNYKIVKKGQFACNRMHVGRDYRLPVALSESDEDFLVSPAYDVFEVIDNGELLSEYLMMWFSRQEYDRNAWFYTDADVRGGLRWDAFCDMEIVIPNINKQKEIVREYKVLVDRINLNNKLIKKLEETAQAIYKQWFVDFEFPDENGKPYKSSGCDMVFCEELDKNIPKGWSAETINCVLQNIKDPINKSKVLSNAHYVPIDVIPKKSLIIDEGLSGDEANSSLIEFKENDILIGAMRVYFHRISIASFDGITRSTSFVLRPYNKDYLLYLLLLCFQEETVAFANSTSQGTTMPYAVWENGLGDYKIVFPSQDIAIMFGEKILPILDNVLNYKKENHIIVATREVLLSKISTIIN